MIINDYIPLLIDKIMFPIEGISREENLQVVFEKCQKMAKMKLIR